MAVSLKKIKPVKADITSSLSMLSGKRNGQETEIQSGAKSVVKSVSVNSQPPSSESPSKQQEARSTSKNTQIVFRTTEDNKNSLKGFFASCGLTLSRGIQLACLYLEQQIDSGRVEISPSGIISGGDR